MKNECADYISRNNFDALIGARSEALAKEAFSRMDVHLDLNMTMIRPLDGLQQSDYLKEFGDVSAATLHPRRSEVNSGQCTPIQSDSAHFRTFTHGRLPKFLPEQFLYIIDTPDSIPVSVAAEMVAFQ